MKLEISDIKEIIGTCKSNSVTVLKGFEFEEKIDISEIIMNKRTYLKKIWNEENLIISFDEYLIFRSNILEIFEEVNIIENNLFINFYPLYTSISTKVIAEFKKHFWDLSSDIDMELIENYLDIYSNIIEITGKDYITYNYSNSLYKDKKEVVYKYYNFENMHKIDIQKNSNIKTLEIKNEESYLRAIEILKTHPKNTEIQVLLNKTIFNYSMYLNKMKIINKVYNSSKIKFIEFSDSFNKQEIKPEYSELLKKYWNAQTFLDLKIYDHTKLSEGIKKVKVTSQATIISDLVDQVEKCKNTEVFQDIFVSAPTGSGKSAIFQIPAIYLGEKYNFFTIVISPLIGLMQDQVENLSNKGYKKVRTINSDISPVKKNEIMEDISNSKCNILYLSPESLMGKSTLEQIIGDRKLGMLIVDEAHIVTTWGKQFRPDYWYLGDHVARLRSNQLKKKGMQFVIATFTATAIYGGLENMYIETIESLNMGDPITYLGYVKREDINIRISPVETIKNRTEYELNKFEALIADIKRSIVYGKKVLIYFPTVALINRFYTYCYASESIIVKHIARYNGQMNKYDKEENFEKFRSGEKLVMAATKAFGMGIDIDNIEIVMHFSPTGNVCDYLQEIGRAARNKDLNGEAIYNFMKNDFKHINRLHGLSIIKKYQLIEIIKKVYHLHLQNISNKSRYKNTNKRNGMLVDADSFAHIFNNPFYDNDDAINKVKTAMLLIQKDFERYLSFSPFNVKPIPLFQMGFFKLSDNIIEEINNSFDNPIKVIDKENNICNVNLEEIWNKEYESKMSFPKFKYLLYTKDEELNFEYKDNFVPALEISIEYEDNYIEKFKEINKVLRHIIVKNSRTRKYISKKEIANELKNNTHLSKYMAKAITEIMISSMRLYSKEFSKSLNAKAFKYRFSKTNDETYMFSSTSIKYFNWLNTKFNLINKNIKDNCLYVVKDDSNDIFKEYTIALGIMESYDILTFKALGGKNSQLYIYINETKTLKQVINNPYNYKNTLLKLIEQRHELSVSMLTFLFENKFSSEEVWKFIEEYFLGQVPEEVIEKYEEKTGSTYRVYQ